MYMMQDIDGKDVALSKFKGKALLIVNVASKWYMFHLPLKLLFTQRHGYLMYSLLWYLRMHVCISQWNGCILFSVVWRHQTIRNSHKCMKSTKLRVSWAFRYYCVRSYFSKPLGGVLLLKRNMWIFYSYEYWFITAFTLQYNHLSILLCSLVNLCVLLAEQS